MNFFYNPLRLQHHHLVRPHVDGKLFEIREVSGAQSLHGHAGSRPFPQSTRCLRAGARSKFTCGVKHSSSEGRNTHWVSKQTWIFTFLDTCWQISLYIPIRRTNSWKNMKHPSPEGGRGLSQGFHLSQRDAPIYTSPFLFPGIPSSWVVSPGPQGSSRNHHQSAGAGMCMQVLLTTRNRSEI